MRKKMNAQFDESSPHLEFINDELTLIEPSEVVPLEPLESNDFADFLFGEPQSSTRRSSCNIESRMNSALTGLIEQRIQTKALPLTMRKRMLYEQARSG